jgi:hypothetical protein
VRPSYAVAGTRSTPQIVTGIAVYLGGDSWAQLPARTYSRKLLEASRDRGHMSTSRDVVISWPSELSVVA